MEDKTEKRFTIFFDVSVDISISAKDFEDAKEKFGIIDKDSNDFEDFLHEKIYVGAYEVRPNVVIVDEKTGKEVVL